MRLTGVIVVQAQLAKGEEVATCPSCSLLVRVVYDMVRSFFNLLVFAGGETGTTEADRSLLSVDGLRR